MGGLWGAEGKKEKNYVSSREIVQNLKRVHENRNFQYSPSANHDLSFLDTTNLYKHPKMH